MSNDRITVNVSFEIPKDRIQAMLVDAFEGGANYWAKVKGYVLPEDLTIEDFYSNGKHGSKEYRQWVYNIPFVEGCFVRIDELTDECDGTTQERMLGFQEIIRGIKLLSQSPDWWKAFMEEDYDQVLGDVYLQLALLGEIRYG